MYLQFILFLSSGFSGAAWLKNLIKKQENIELVSVLSYLLMAWGPYINMDQPNLSMDE